MISKANQIRSWVKWFFLILTLTLLSIPTSAQLKGSDVPGFVGLQAGTQAPPGIYVGDLAYFYNTNTIKLDNGNAIPNSPRVSAFIDGIAFAWVTNYKFLGATIGGQLLIP